MWITPNLQNYWKNLWKNYVYFYFFKLLFCFWKTLDFPHKEHSIEEDFCRGEHYSCFGILVNREICELSDGPICCLDELYSNNFTHLSRELFIGLQAHQDPALCNGSWLSLNYGTLKQNQAARGLTKLIGVLSSFALYFLLFLTTQGGKHHFSIANAFRVAIQSWKGRNFLSGKFCPSQEITCSLASLELSQIFVEMLKMGMRRHYAFCVVSANWF